MSLMFEDKTRPLFVVIAEAAEGTALADFTDHCRDRCDRFARVWAAVSSSPIYFIHIGQYAESDPGDAENQNEAYYTVSEEREDSLYISLYAPTGGIVWNNSDQPAQSNWAAANGYDAIENNNGTLDASEGVFTDGGPHPVGNKGAFFWAWLARKQIKALVADLDDDGEVGIVDFLLLLSQWGDCDDPCPPYCLGDIDKDCTVGITDFLILLASWG